MSFITKLKNNEVCYFRFELDENILKKLNLAHKNKYVYARMLNHGAEIPYFFGFFLCAVYDLFTDKSLKDIKKIKESDYLFNQKLSLKPPMRGVLKWSLLETEPIETINLEEVLPHFVFSHFVEDENTIEDYFKGPIYEFHPQIERTKSEYRNLKHLENKRITDTFQIREDIYLELLKLQKKNYTDKELEKFLIIIKNEEWDKMDKRQKRIALRDFIFGYKQPIFQDIPKKYRERAINEVD